MPFKFTYSIELMSAHSLVGIHGTYIVEIHIKCKAGGGVEKRTKMTHSNHHLLGFLSTFH